MGWTVRGSNLVGARFSAPVQTGPGAHPASCTMGTGYFPEVKQSGRGVDHPPPSSAEIKERVELYLYSTSGPSWPAIGWTLPLPLLGQLNRSMSWFDYVACYWTSALNIWHYWCQEKITHGRYRHCWEHDIEIHLRDIWRVWWCGPNWTWRQRPLSSSVNMIMKLQIS
jgi:hypothetical protein